MTPPNQQTDQELLSLIKEDGRAAFNTIYSKYWPELYNTAYKRNHNKQLSQDLVQNVFADLWLRRGTVSIDNLPAYLHTAVRFQLYKQTSRQPAGAVYLDSFAEIICSPIRTDDALLEKEIIQLINLWLIALPEKRRKIFLLHYTDELSTREIAELLGISQNTVQNQLYTASQSLRSRLAQFLTVAVIFSVIK